MEEKLKNQYAFHPFFPTTLLRVYGQLAVLRVTQPT